MKVWHAILLGVLVGILTCGPSVRADRSWTMTTIPSATQLLLDNGTVSAPGISWSAQPAVGFYASGTTGWAYGTASANTLLIYGSGIRMGASKQIGFSSNADATVAADDTILKRNAANVLQMVNGANTQSLILGAVGSAAGFITLGGTTQATLGTPSDGTLKYCNDCNANCATGSGTGVWCKRVNGAWVAF